MVLNLAGNCFVCCPLPKLACDFFYCRETSAKDKQLVAETERGRGAALFLLDNFILQKWITKEGRSLDEKETDCGST